MQRWRIVYPRGDKSKLSIALVFDYEEDDYALASRNSYDSEDEAYEYMKELAENHGLKFDRKDSDHEYLD